MDNIRAVEHMRCTVQVCSPQHTSRSQTWELVQQLLLSYSLIFLVCFTL